MKKTLSTLLALGALVIPPAALWASAGDATLVGPGSQGANATAKTKTHHHGGHHKKSAAKTPAATTPAK